jgi:transposase-like protein
MAWLQIYCPKCKHHMSHKAIIKRLFAGSVYKCPKCNHEFGVRTK